jgi:RNA polymerase sigma factor (sigma-70 family)
MSVIVGGADVVDNARESVANQLMRDYLRSGENQFLGRLVDHARPLILKIARRRTDIPVECREDVLQETAKEILEGARDFDAVRESVVTWVRRLAWRAAQRIARQAHVAKTSIGDDDGYMSSDPSPVDRAAFVEWQTDLTAAVKGLSARDHEPIVGRYYQDLRPEDLALTLGECKNTVKSRLGRSLDKVHASVLEHRLERAAEQEPVTCGRASSGPMSTYYSYDMAGGARSTIVAHASPVGASQTSSKSKVYEVVYGFSADPRAGERPGSGDSFLATGAMGTAALPHGGAQS